MPLINSQQSTGTFALCFIKDSWYGPATFEFLRSFDSPTPLSFCAALVVEDVVDQDAVLDRVPATKLKLATHDSSVERKKNCEHYAVIGDTLLLRSCPLPSQPQISLPASSKIVLPSIKSVSLPELLLHINFSDIQTTRLPSLPP